jgi:hypothetical protein
LIPRVFWAPIFPGSDLLGVPSRQRGPALRSGACPAWRLDPWQSTRPAPATAGRSYVAKAIAGLAAAVEVKALVREMKAPPCASGPNHGAAEASKVGTHRR